MSISSDVVNCSNTLKEALQKGEALPHLFLLAKDLYKAWIKNENDDNPWIHVDDSNEDKCDAITLTLLSMETMFNTEPSNGSYSDLNVTQSNSIMSLADDDKEKLERMIREYSKMVEDEINQEITS